MRNDPSGASVRVSYAWDEVNNTLKTVNEDHYYPFGLQHKGYTRIAIREIVRESDLIEIGIGLAAPGGGSTSGSANYKYKTMIIELKVLRELLANIPHEVLNYKMN